MKDIFNGKVKSNYIKWAKNHIIAASIICIVIATGLLIFAILYHDIVYESRIVLFVICSLGYAYAAVYPPLTISCIRKFPKYKRLLNILLTDDILIDVSENDEQNSL